MLFNFSLVVVRLLGIRHCASVRLHLPMRVCGKNMITHGDFSSRRGDLFFLPKDPPLPLRTPRGVRSPNVFEIAPRGVHRGYYGCRSDLDPAMVRVGPR